MPWRNKKMAQLMWERGTLWYALKCRWKDADELAFSAKYDRSMSAGERRVWNNRLLGFIVLVTVDIIG